MKRLVNELDEETVENFAYYDEYKEVELQMFKEDLGIDDEEEFE